MKVLLVEPYFGGSHQAWAEGYARHSSHDVSLLTMPARFWTWRMRGGAITLASETDRWVAEHGRPDLVLATDMLDLPTYLGSARRSLADTPVALYFHESQFTYPWSPKLRADLQYAYLNWSSMAAADLVLFNSSFHRRVVFEELPKYLRQFPDFTHEHLIDEVRERSDVLPLGVDLRRLDAAGSPSDTNGPPLILWNQRWEHDKDPAAFFRAMFGLADDGLDFRLAVCGENFRQVPEEFAEAEQRLSDRLIHFGWADEEAYIRLLRSAEVVVSTALQEFFGIAIVEAAYAGAFPVLPDRLSYPEIMPASVHDLVLYQEGELQDRLRWTLAHPAERRSAAASLKESLGNFDWSVMAVRYDRVLTELG
jgi:glycosyltransferase involved in cell wall biosynthesis